MPNSPDYSESINSLENTLDGMDAMANKANKTIYKLANASGGKGLTYMNNKEEVIFETNGSVENFIHEVNHGIQYENNRLGFIPGTRNILSSVENEVDAYRAEFAYGGKLAEGINPSIPKVMGSSQITDSYVRGIESNGTRIYNIPQIAKTSINPDMGMDAINKAWPGNKFDVKPFETLRTIYPQVKWKN